MDQKKTIGIREVAKAAGVSISTVSNALNGTKAVSPALEARVRDTAKRLGYQANHMARGLKSGKTNMLCVIVPSIMSVFFPKVLRGMQVCAAEHGYSLSIYETNQQSINERSIIERLSRQWVDGILLSTSADMDKDAAYLEGLSRLSIGGKFIPVVLYEAVPNSLLDAVVVDNRAAAREAVRYLIGLGRNPVAHIAAPLRFSMGTLRKRGYLDAVKEAGMEPPPVFEGDYSARSGYDNMRSLLWQGMRPGAVFAGNDQMAIGAIHAILEAGYRIPEDIAVMGFDDSFPGTLVTPALSSVSVPKQEMGKRAVELLLWRMEAGPLHEGAPQSIVTLDTTLAIRRSTNARADSGWDLQDW